MLQLLIHICNSPTALVGLSAFIATFVGAVMADEQNERLRQSAFGAIAGSSVGGLAAAMEKDPNLLLIGVFGSAVGALLGWIVYLGLSVAASYKPVRRLIEYQVTGLKGLRQQLDQADKKLLETALTTWSQNYRGMVLRETNHIVQNTEAASYDEWATVTIRTWLTSVIDAFNLVLDVLADKSQYRSRITLIVFGKRGDQIEGRHWITYAGHQQNHKSSSFGAESVAYQVASGQKNSPCLVSMEEANKEGENRQNPTYNSFLVFKINERAVISIDWPGKILEEDPYVDIARALIHQDVGPAIATILAKKQKQICSEVGLSPFSLER